jgi:hypothetical protein
MMERKTYRVTAERESDWWYVRVEDIGHSTQAKRLDRVEYMARDLIAFAEDVPEDGFDVELTIALGSAQAALDEALAARSEAEASQRVAQESTRAAAVALRQVGMPLRDIGQLLGLTHQRISQLVAE